MSETTDQPHVIVPIPSKAWDERADAASTATQRKRSRWDEPAPSAYSSTASTKSNDGSSETIPVVDKKSKALALQASISARLAALKSKQPTVLAPAVVQETQSSSLPFTSSSNEDSTIRATKKAKVYDWDVNITTPLDRQKEMEEKEKLKKSTIKKIQNPYLDHLVPTDNSKKDTQSGSKEVQADLHPDTGNKIIVDSRLAGGNIIKNRVRNKAFHFIEPGTFQALAERKRQKEANAIQSGFVSGRKEGTYVKSSGIATTTLIELDGSTDIQITESSQLLAPRADAPEESMDGSTATSGGVVVIPMPLVMEWWDVELLPGKLKKEVIAREGQALMESLANKSLKKKRIILDRASTEVHTFQHTSDNVGTKMEIDQDAIDNSELKPMDEILEDEEITRLRKKCFLTASILNSKTASLIQHPVPVIPLHLRGKEAEQVSVATLHLTKKERKRQRKLRRAERQRELQDLQAVGMIPPPEPRLTLSNFIKVLGDQAILDPSKMEAKVLEQMQARKLKHETTNQQRMLTEEQRKAKKSKKLSKDDALTSSVVTVALFMVKDMSHRYHRTKVDLNAQQNQITGGVLECASPEFSLVICEGGSRAIRRYTRLMLERMKWKGENMLDRGDSDDDNDGNEPMDGTNPSNMDEPKQKFNPENYCQLVWTGMSPKRMFNTFAFQSCPNAESARKVLEAKGVAHFWDQVVVHASGMGETFNFRLGL